MCARNRTYSIYLLKTGFDATNAIKDKSNLKQCSASELPPGALMFVTLSSVNDPWWKKFWGATFDQQQRNVSSLVFFPYNDRIFVFSYGYAHSSLKDNSYEYDFGLITTLNALDPQQLRSADALVLESDRRERLQAPVSQDITFFEIDNDTTIIRSFTGKTKAEYKDLMKNITGADNVRVTNKLSANELDTLLKTLSDLYRSTDYQTSFPNINNIHPEKDPSITGELNNQLISYIKVNSIEIELTIPDLIDYQEYFGVSFSLNDYIGETKDDLTTDEFYNFLKEDNNIKVFSDDFLNKIKVRVLMKEDDANPVIYPLKKCILFSTSYKGIDYHLCDGSWYEVNSDFIKKINKRIDTCFIDNRKYNVCSKNQSEGDYNLAQVNEEIVCFDKKNIADSGNIEPCDLFHVENGKSVFTHIKKSTRSSLLSHLFNQGYVSIRLLRQNEESRQKLKNLLAETRLDPVKKEDYFEAIDNTRNYHVEYGIITTKDISKKAENLPLFSRITLLRIIKDFEISNIDVSVFYIAEK